MDLKETFFIKFLLSILGVSGSLCFGHWMTLSMGFKTRMDSSSSTLFCYLYMCKDPQSHLWLLGLAIEPGSLACEVILIPLLQPTKRNLRCVLRHKIRRKRSFLIDFAEFILQDDCFSTNESYLCVPF